MYALNTCTRQYQNLPIKVKNYRQSSLVKYKCAKDTTVACNAQRLAVA